MAAAMVLSMSSSWIGGSSWLWARRGLYRAVDGSEDALPCPRCDRRPATCLVCCSRSRARSPSSAVLVSATNSRKRGCGLPPCTQLGRGTCDPSYMSHPSFPRRTARAWPAGRLGRRRFVVPRRVWLPTSCSRQGRARRHSRKFPSPTNHRPATGHISRACREAATTRSTPQVASAPRARTSPPSWSCTCSAGSGHR